MKIASHLTASRHNVFYFRFPIPQHLHPERVQSSIRLSLDTRCPKEALHLSRALSYAGNQLLKKPEIYGMEYQDIREVLFDHFKAMRERMKQRINTHGRLTQQDKAALVNSKGLAETALQDKDYSLVGGDDELNGLIDDYALPITRNTDHYATLRTEFLKAFRDYCGSVMEYDSRFEGYNFKTDPASLAMQQATKRTAKKKLADVLEVYIAEKLRLNKWRENVAREYRTQFNLLLRYLGEDASLHITDAVASDVKNMLLRMPVNAGKKKELKNKSVHELIALQGYERLSAPSVSKYIGSYSTFYDWAVKRKETSENPFASLVDDVKQVYKERDPFTLAQSRTIINAALKAKYPHQKWGTLIAFYTGARLNEVAQLDVADIRQVEGVWCIDINDKGEFKRLKNKASRRIVPVHSKLIEWGLLDYVKGADTVRLFPALSYHSKDGYGRNLGRWFNESLLPKLGIKSDKLVYHSIRHTVADQLRNNAVELSTIKDIMGHTHGDVTIDVYASKLHKGLMQKALETLAYA
jgi:integrase